jgi:hypothetical protein
MSYGKRDEIVEAMGFRKYSDYLKSNRWKVIRSHILFRDAYICRICSTRKATEVHHFTYSESELLISTCRDCHQAIEFDSEGKKRCLKDVQKDFLEKVLRTKLQKGVSNPKIGRWFRNHRQANKPVLEAIAESIKQLQAN